VPAQTGFLAVRDIIESGKSGSLFIRDCVPDAILPGGNLTDFQSGLFTAKNINIEK
jgi:hypothetical protein